MTSRWRGRAALWACVCGWVLVVAAGSASGSITAPDEGSRTITLVVRDADVREVFEMIARSENLNIAVGGEIDATVSISLFEVEVEEAIEAIAMAAGYAVELRDDTWVVVETDDLGRDFVGGATEVQSFRLQYADAEQTRAVLEKHLSRYGEISALQDRSMIVIEDLPSFLERAARIVRSLDREPAQILLEAKVLEIRLDSSDTLGVDWTRVVDLEGSDITIGLQGLTTGTAPGLFFDILNDNLDGAIEALADDGRVRALATPRLMTLEGREAEVLVGQRLGFRVTTTINQVTTESVEFIESGVILRFTPSIDRDGRIRLQIHPEVSTGVIEDGIPSVSTTEVTTELVADDGEQIFIGGLLRDSASESRRGIPLISRIPILGLLFSRSEWVHSSTETVVIVRATIRDSASVVDREQKRRIDVFEGPLDERRRELEDELDLPWWDATRDAAAPDGAGAASPAP